jgi:ferredoxin
LSGRVGAVKRKIIEIDRNLCNGCGQCTTVCAEGALELDREGKAVLVKDIFCDGLGACLDVCPTGALKVVDKEAAAYDEDAAIAHVSAGCPEARARSFSPASRRSGASELGQWPIQLHLVSPAAPYFHECDLLVAADCTAFALGSFHADLLRGKALVIACPKLDDDEGYVDKLAELISSNTIYSLTVAIMEVPCCSGLARIVEAAVAKSGKNIAVRSVVVGLDGQHQ